MHQLTTSVQLVLAQHCNGTKQGRLFGGQILAWIDVVGGAAARRYAHTEVTTACIDDLQKYYAYSLQVPESEKAREYLKKRNIPEDQIILVPVGGIKKLEPTEYDRRVMIELVKEIE